MSTHKVIKIRNLSNDEKTYIGGGYGRCICKSSRGESLNLGVKFDIGMCIRECQELPPRTWRFGSFDACDANGTLL